MAKKKKKSSFSLRKLIYNDKYLIIISIVIAVVIWVASSMNLSPETTKTVTVPVTVDFSDSAADHLGIKCYGEKSIDVDVTISCKKYLAKDINADDLTVTLQTNTVTTNGNMEVPIKVEANSSDFNVLGFYPTTYRAYFDVEDSKILDVTLNYKKDKFVADGYVQGDALLSESSIKLTGPKTYISQVNELCADVDFPNELTTTQTIELALEPCDSYGNLVNYITLETKNDNVSLTIPVLKMTELDVTTSFVNKPKGITEDFTVLYSVSKVSAGALEEANIKSANIGSIDFSQLTTGQNRFTFNVQNLDSIVILDDVVEIDATVYVPSNYSSKTFMITTDNIDVINVPKGYKYSIEGINSGRATVVGPKEQLENLTTKNITFVVDFSNVENPADGVSKYNTTSAVENADKCWVYGDTSVKINLYK